ncbi:MAG: TolC family protein, partial [Desulfobacterales bacterium]|nr:TolC family protein [Desulfobacterales bacterium]
QAAAVYGIMKSALIPSLDVGASLGRSRTKSSSDNTYVNENAIDFQAALSWEPDIWGKIRNRKDAASLKYDEKLAMFDQIALNLQSLLVETWISYHSESLTENLLTKQRETISNIMSLSVMRLAQGDANIVDVLQQKVNLTGIERLMPGVVSKKKRIVNAYAVLLGCQPTEVCQPAEKWPVIEPLKSLSSPKELITARPDLRAAFLTLKAADHEVAAAIGDRLPTLTIGFKYLITGQKFSDIGRDTAVSLIGGLLTPVFDAGRLKAKLSLKEGQVIEAVAILEHALLKAVQEVEDALIQENALFDEKDLLNKEIRLSMELVDQTRLQYVNGKDSFLEVLNALSKLQVLQQDEIRLKQKLLINRSRLLKALGAKWRKHREVI